MKKTIELSIKILIYISFFVPLLVLPNSFIFPFIVPKIVILRSIIVLMLVGYIALLIINWQEYKPKLTALNSILAAFFVAFAISTFSGVDWYHSFWDNHERMLGLFTITHYVIYYFICTAIFKNWKEWRMALRMFLIAGSVVMVIAILQVKDPYLLLNQGGARVASTLGNAIYVGGYGLFLMFVSFLLLIREKYGFWFWLEMFIGIVALLGMVFSGTRGSMLGLVAGIGIVLIGYIIILKDKPKVRKVLGAIIIAGILLLGGLYLARQSDFVKKIPAVDRAVNTSFSSFKQSARWMAWDIAVESWTEKPVFGWGPNNYFYAFNKLYNPKLLEHGYGETWFDNAHNIILNTLSVQGAFGLIVYLSIYGFAITVLWRGNKRTGVNKHVVVLGTGFLIAHLVGNVTVFENPTSYLYFMFWLAMINKLTTPKETSSEKAEELLSGGSSNENIAKLVIGPLLIAALVFIFFTNIQPARANNKTLIALKTINSNPALAVDSIKQAYDISSPHIDDIRSDLGRTITQVFNNLYQKLGKEKSEEILDLVYDDLKKNIVLHPLDIRNHMTLSQIARIKAVINKDSKHMADSERYIIDSLKLSPKRQQIIYTLAGMKLEFRDYDTAIKLLEQAISDNPNISESYWRLSYAYKVMDKMDKSKEVITNARKNNIRFTEREEEIITGIMTVTKIEPVVDGK